VKTGDDPWATCASAGQPEPAAPPPRARTAGHAGEEPDPWASTSAPDGPEPSPDGPGNSSGGGTCYLLHFDRPYISANGKGVAKHYTGFADSSRSLKSRLAEHEKGRGARLLQVVKAAGITWTLARTWPGGRGRERQLKNQGGASRRCPECGVTPRGNPAERKDTPAAKRPDDRQTGRAQPSSRSPHRADPSWTRAELAAQIQRLGAAPTAASPAGQKQPREPDSPHLPDLEAEP
jgi:predicted GIY-YIG superfamily endonuclease